MRIFSFPSIVILALGQGQGTPSSDHYLPRGYWLSTQYKLGINPNKDSSFIPIRYIYSDGKAYSVQTYRDEEHLVRIVKQADGLEQLIGVLFNANYLRNEYLGYEFFLEKEKDKFYLLSKYKGNTCKTLLRKSSKIN